MIPLQDYHLKGDTATREDYIAHYLQHIAAALETLARAQGPAPELNLVRPLAEYPGFDWASIDASLIKGDQYGPTHVEHGGYVYTRRSPQNKFGEAIWYSRATGKAEDGTTTYARLITFRKLADADSLPDKVVQAVKAAMPAIATHQGATAPARLTGPSAGPARQPAAADMDDISFDDDDGTIVPKKDAIVPGTSTIVQRLRQAAETANGNADRPAADAARDTLVKQMIRKGLKAAEARRLLQAVAGEQLTIGQAVALGNWLRSAQFQAEAQAILGT